MQGVPHSDAIAEAEQKEKERLYQCSTCKRSFTRVDHLMRHVRSHTKQRPYICPTCSKGFARVDLLKRHAANHASDNAKKRQRPETVRQSRVVQACEACSQNHLRCEDEKPCSRCRKKSIECRLPGPIQTDLDVAQDLLDLSTSLEHSSHLLDPQQESTSPHTLEQTVQEAIMVTPQSMPSSTDMMDYAPSTEAQSTIHEFNAPVSFQDDTVLPLNEESPIDPLLPDYLRNMPPLETCLSGFATPREPLDFSFNWDLDLTCLDFGILDQYNLPETVHEEVVFPDAQFTGQQSNLEMHRDDAAARAEAFKRSVWRYMPPQNLNPGAADEPNLALSDEERDKQVHSRVPSHRVTKERLSYGSRDRLLTLVLSTSNLVNVKRIAAGFPSLELLDGILQIFFAEATIDAKSWFHLPTFSSSKAPSELIAVMIAAGAITTPDVRLQKLGLALHEASRVGLVKAFDGDNSAIRDIQYLRIQLLQVEVGMWSGFSRKMEIAESFLQPPVTMLRRGGRFRRSTWKEIVPSPSDNGQVLQEKWQQWVLQESWLRLVYRFLEHDRKSSMALLIPPLISYSEIQLPLVHADSLWYAPSATAWKAAYLLSAIHQSKRPSIDDCIHDLENLSYHDTASSAYLYMVWGMIWEYRQMVTMMAKSPLGDSLLLTTRHQELSRHCENFRVNSSPLDKGVEIILEEMLLHLNAPLDDVQTFAGIAGPEEAKHAFRKLRDWVTTPLARQALWHAAQILRVSETLSKGLLRNFFAMAVYHATLVLWVYGLLKRPSDSTSPGNAPLLVSINEEENMDVRRFMKLDRGEPALKRGQAQGSIIPLSNASEVIDLARHILRQNHDPLEGSYPPLVENLVQLMEGLQSATK